MHTSGAAPLRLLIVNATETGFNGQTMFILKYLRNMDLKGMDVGYTAVNEPPESIRAELEALGVRVYAFPRRNRRPLGYMLGLIKLIRREKYRVVHVHGNSATLAVETASAWLGGAKARIAHSHNTYCMHPHFDKLLRPLFHLTTNARMACGTEAGRWMFGRRPFEIIPIAADPTRYRFDEERRRAAREAMDIADGEILLGVVALLSPFKNHGFLLKAFALARRKNPRLRLAIIGEGPLRQELETAIARMDLTDAAFLTGNVDDVPDRLQAMDMMVLPSLYEGFPNVLIEAQIAGLPVLVSDRVTRDCDLTGLLRYLPLETKVWAEAMAAAAFTDRAEQSAHGCRRLAECGYDVRVEAAKLRARYEALAAGRGDGK